MALSFKQEAERQMEQIERGVVEIIPREELLRKLEKSIREKKPLRIKLGLDPTAPDIHLGHTVVLNKLRQFQDLGHEVHLIIGDFTGRIGDPSGKSETRRQLTEDEIMINARTYQEQIYKVLDREKTIMHFNSEWLGRLTFIDVLQLAGKYTVARMMERDDFEKRFKEGLPIGVHELMYPLMQGYDSVALEADVEMGGTDQKFNLLVGRHLLREYGLEPQVALMMPILEGTDGIQKMSKSLGNYIGVSEEPYEMFGKTMSINDRLICRYFELLTRVSMPEIEDMRTRMEKGEMNPRDAKMRLAVEIISTFHSSEEAAQAQEKFLLIYSQRDIPEDIPDLQVDQTLVWLPRFLSESGLAESSSEVRRLLKQGAVKVDGEKHIEEDLELANGMVIQIGKRKFVKIVKGQD
ncbi:MAG: tyrosine--tRNA ligase [Syntrophomonadaceae bacterium]